MVAVNEVATRTRFAADAVVETVDTDVADARTRSDPTPVETIVGIVTLLLNSTFGSVDILSEQSELSDAFCTLFAVALAPD